MGATVLRVAAVATLAALASAARGQELPGEPVKRFSIGAQPLSQALLEFSRQADIIVTVSSDLVRGKHVPGLRGDFTPADALSQLLRGSGLQAFFTASGAVTIGPQRNGHSNEQSRNVKPGGTRPRSPHRDRPGSEDVLEEVLVTAQKRTEDIQRVPSSVSVLNSRRLRQLHATTLTDYAGYVSGLNVTNVGSPGQGTISLRGITPLAPGATVGIYVDDTPLGSSSNYGSEFDLDLIPEDVQHMEVLRGPQGTLYGAGAMGGLLKYVLREPDLTDLRVRLGAETSTIDSAGELGWGARAALNAPLRSERLGLWASYAKQETPGYIDNAFTHASNENPVGQQSGRVALRWQIDDALSLKLGGLWQQIDAGGNARMLLRLTGLDPPRGTPSHGELASFHPLPERFRSDLDHYSASLQWELGWATFVSASGYSKTLTTRQQDVSLIFGGLYPQLSDGAVPAGYTPLRVAIDVNKRTQEFRLASPTDGRVEWLLGAFYTKENSHQYRHLLALDRAHQPIAQFAPLFAFSDFHSDYEEVAGFASITFKLDDRFDLTGGVRWARNEQRLREVIGGAQEVVGPPIDLSGDSAENVLTYMVSPRMHVSDDTMLYARVATGYRAGGPAPRVRDLSPTVDADMLINYEIGLKIQFPERRALLNVATYYIDWSDVQQTLSFGGAGGIQNSGDAVSKGFELEAALSPFPGWRLDLNAVYSDARLVSSQPGPGNRPGARLSNVPHWSASALLDYEIAIGKATLARVGAGYRYVGEQASAFAAHAGVDTSYVRPAYGVLDLSADVNRGAWTARLFARNVLDKRAYVGGGLVSTATADPYIIEVSVLQPRTVGIGVDIVF